MRAPFCRYHKTRHPSPTHCRWCGKDLPNAKLWYCGGLSGLCAAAFFAMDNWGEARRLALARAQNMCQRCGGTQGLEVHHIKGVRGAPRNGEANSPENLLALCHRCHREMHQSQKRPRLNPSQLALPLAWEV